MTRRLTNMIIGIASKTSVECRGTDRWGGIAKIPTYGSSLEFRVTEVLNLRIRGGILVWLKVLTDSLLSR
jgi:hypothetical protein